MRSMKLFVLSAALAVAVAGCKKEGVEGPLAGCQPVSFSSHCSADSECCSFGCVYGTCMPNPLEGGVCATHGDCQAPRLCIGGHCTTAACNTGGACSPGSAPCCSGTCTSGLCPTDTPPTAVPGRTTGASPVPWHVPVVLTNLSTDAQTGSIGLSYLWDVTGPTSSTATFLPSATYPTPTFTPDAEGTYVIGLTASNAGGSNYATITFDVENTVPVVTVDPYMVATTKSRNVPFTFTVPVSDADGGPVTCAWSKIPPLPAAQDPILVSSASPCAAQTGGPASGSSMVTFSEDVEGIWTLVLTTSDGAPANIRTWNRFITVVNDRPTIDPMPGRVGNFGAPGEVAPGIPLHATARDVNGDVGQGYFTYSWKLTATKPAADTRPSGTEIGTGPDPLFVPSAVGAYQIRLDADDAHTNGTATAYVDVLVEPYILPLGEVSDAVHHKNSNKILAVGKAVDNTNRLWIIDPTVPSILYDIPLAAHPTCVALSFDGADAIVGETGGWQLVTGIQTTPVAAPQRGFYNAGILQSAEASSIVHFTASNGVRSGYATDTGGHAFELYLDAAAAPFSRRANCPSCSTLEAPRGTRVAANATTLWLLDRADGRLARYAVSDSNFNLSFGLGTTNTGLTGTGARGLWLGADGLDLFTTTRSVYAADTLVARSSQLDSARDHLDTTLNGGLKGISAIWTSSALTRIGSTYADAGTIQLPQVGRNGTGYPALGQFAFVKQDEGGFYAIVRANTGTFEWGLAKTP